VDHKGEAGQTEHVPELLERLGPLIAALEAEVGWYDTNEGDES